MNWQEFEQQAPELARLGRERFEQAGSVLLGTIRRDGSPRISPVEAYIVDGELLLGMMWRSKKALDLLRDPRCLVHNMVADRSGHDGEFKLRGRALDVQDPAVRERQAQAQWEAIQWRPEEPYHLFSVDIESAVFIRYAEDGSQQVVRWP